MVVKTKFDATMHLQYLAYWHKQYSILKIFILYAILRGRKKRSSTQPCFHDFWGFGEWWGCGKDWRGGGTVPERSVGMRRSRNPGKPVFWEFAVSKRTKSHPNKYYSKIRSTTVASQAFTRSAGEMESCIPRIPALMWIFSRLIAEESMKVRSFFFIPRGEHPPRT